MLISSESQVNAGGSASTRSCLETHFPRLWLPSTNALYFGNGWVHRGLRPPSYDISDAPSPSVGIAPMRMIRTSTALGIQTNGCLHGLLKRETSS